MGVDHFTHLGAHVQAARITNRAEAEDVRFAEMLEQADLIYFSGGDPGYLFSCLKDTLLWKQVYQRYLKGAILAGSSAGAMVFGHYLLANPYAVGEHQAAPQWTPALNLTPYTILPHYDFLAHHESRLFNALLTNIKPRIKHSLLGIDENTALLLRAGSVQVMGKGTIQCPR
jgi:cyanophycinase